MPHRFGGAAVVSAAAGPQPGDPDQARQQRQGRWQRPRHRDVAGRGGDIGQHHRPAQPPVQQRGDREERHQQQHPDDLDAVDVHPGAEQHRVIGTGRL
ncbi:hypothetical protein [Krasilnikovia sp. MM14-A1259]|uniref:hypothetical protein n=1 Tax=Krasilnikovia sp. MM14-A1259 TaxID=3373539 RepID=UPI00399CE505